MSSTTTPDISSLIQSLLLGNSPAATQAAPMPQATQSPSLSDILSQIMGTNQQTSSQQTVGNPIMPQLPVANNAGLLPASNMILNASPQNILPSAGALSQQNVPMPATEMLPQALLMQMQGGQNGRS